MAIAPLMSSADIPTQVSRIMTLKVGDVISLEKPERVQVFSDGHPVFNGEYGLLNKQLAVKVDRIFAASRLPFNKETSP